MIETTVQPTRAAQVTDAAFDAVAEAAGGTEPRLMLLSLPGLGLVAGLGQAHAPYAQFPGLAFIRGRIDPAIAAHFTRGFAELTPMGFQTGLELLGIRRIAGQNAILADQAAIDFGVPDLVTELGVFGFGFAATNDGGVRRLACPPAPVGLGQGIKQADHFLARGHGHAF